jgi:hypothetical protein
MVKFYEAAEAILSHLSRRGLPMILREVEHVKADAENCSANGSADALSDEEMLRTQAGEPNGNNRSE